MKIIDISQRIFEGMTVYPGDPHFSSRCVSSFKDGSICEVSELTIGSHCGTHIDAPLHMIPDGGTLESIPLERFVGPCRVLTIPAAVITDKMLQERQIQEGERILLRTDPKGKYADSFNPAVLSIRAAQYLAEKKTVLVGIDAPTVENMEICSGEIHRMLLSSGVALLEGLRLEHAVKERYHLCAVPLSLVGENGSPCRAILVEE